ncbi:type II secretion system protein N [soil metagenome]
MMGLSLSRRARLGLLALFALSLLLLLPMRMAFGLFGMDRYGVTARSMAGSVWAGRIGQLGIGEVPLGTLDAGLSPLQLLVGRARINVASRDGTNALAGGLTSGIGRTGIDDVTGTLPLGVAAAPLPISAVELTEVSAHFAGNACADAQGQVRARIAGAAGGLNLAQGLSGTARCEGAALLLPLVSQSGLEKLDVRLSANGRYIAELRVTTSDPALAQELMAQGFARAGEVLAIRVEGTL